MESRRSYKCLVNLAAGEQGTFIMPVTEQGAETLSP